MVIVYKAPVSLTTVFKTCYSPDLERADFDRQSFQYMWLNSYFFSSLRESKKGPNILSYYELLDSCDIVRSLLQQLSLSLRYLVLLYTALWYTESIVTLSITATTQEAVTNTSRGGKMQDYRIRNVLLYATTRGGEDCLYIPK